MTALAIGRGMHIMFGNQFFAELFLVFYIIAHGGDLFNRPQMLLRVPVAIETPAHT